LRENARSWFGNALRILAYVSALFLGVVFVERISNAGMRDSFRMVQLSGKPGGKPGEERKRVTASVRESWKPGRSGRVCFPLVSLGVLTGEGQTHMD